MSETRDKTSVLLHLRPCPICKQTEGFRMEKYQNPPHYRGALIHRCGHTVKKRVISGPSLDVALQDAWNEQEGIPPEMGIKTVRVPYQIIRK